jgi:hypothetical protein
MTRRQTEKSHGKKLKQSTTKRGIDTLELKLGGWLILINRSTSRAIFSFISNLPQVVDWAET